MPRAVRRVVEIENVEAFSLHRSRERFSELRNIPLVATNLCCWPAAGDFFKWFSTKNESKR